MLLPRNQWIDRIPIFLVSPRFNRVLKKEKLAPRVCIIDKFSGTNNSFSTRVWWNENCLPVFLIEILRYFWNDESVARRIEPSKNGTELCPWFGALNAIVNNSSWKRARHGEHRRVREGSDSFLVNRCAAKWPPQSATTTTPYSLATWSSASMINGIRASNWGESSRISMDGDLFVARIRANVNYSRFYPYLIIEREREREN